MNFIVCGPPGSGKTTFVKKHMKYGDLIVDLDAIFVAISGMGIHEKPTGLLDIALNIKDYLIASIPRYQNKFYNAWVITGGADLGERNRLANQLRAKVYVLEISINECTRRISNDIRNHQRGGTQELWEALVKKWWGRYEKCEQDTVLTEFDEVKTGETL